MRRKTTIHNYGKYHEVCFVCNTRRLPFCERLAETLEYEYGVMASAVDYTTFPQADKKVKKILRTAYHVVFMLSDGVMEESVNNPEHPFLQIYAYVHTYNGFSMSCATLDKYVVSDGLTYPSFMSGFNHMHRKVISTTANLQDEANALFKEIRLYYSIDRKVTLMTAHQHGREGYRSYCYYLDRYKRLYILSGVLLLAVFLIVFVLSGWDITSATMAHSILLLPVAICYYIMQARVNMYKKCALYADLDDEKGYDEYWELSGLTRRIEDKITAIKRWEWCKATLGILGWFTYTSLMLGLTEQDSSTVLQLSYYLCVYYVWCCGRIASSYMEKMVLTTHSRSVALQMSAAMHRVSVVALGVRLGFSLVAAIVYPLLMQGDASWITSLFIQ